MECLLQQRLRVKGRTFQKNKKLLSTTALRVIYIECVLDRTHTEKLCSITHAYKHTRTQTHTHLMSRSATKRIHTHTQTLSLSLSLSHTHTHTFHEQISLKEHFPAKRNHSVLLLLRSQVSSATYFTTCYLALS